LENTLKYVMHYSVPEFNKDFFCVVDSVSSPYFSARVN
jgi:hypothetical protein